MSFLSKKKTKNGHSKNQKKKKFREKGQKIQLAQLCSQIVFMIFGGGLQKCRFFAENAIKIVVSAYFLKRKMAQNAKKVESKLGPRLSQNLLQVCCAT